MERGGTGGVMVVTSERDGGHAVIAQLGQWDGIQQLGAYADADSAPKPAS